MPPDTPAPPRLQLRGAILRAIELFPAAKHLLHDERYQHAAAAALHSGGAGGSGSGAGGGAYEPLIPPEVAAAAQALVEHVLSCCLQVRGAVSLLLRGEELAGGVWLLL